MDTSEAITISYSEGKDFEILVDPDLAKEAKLEGKEYEIQRLLFVQEVFTDASAGERASADELEAEFNTKQIMDAAEEVFEKGEMQLTTDQKAEMREEKYRQVVNMIARRVQNPQTGNPHPPKRIENALEEAGFNIQAMDDVEEKFDEAVDQLKPIIPVSLEEKAMAVKIPNDKTGKAYDLLQQKTDLEEEKWGNEYFYAKMTLPAGILEELMRDIQEATDGEAVFTEDK
ncbi:MAG: conserved hypothetical protein TIGR00291 family [Candidatus Nanosalina sp. J07AB43]|nr:MAG: conserved hypothetical protein TIGR00291 family [Candidatus Nanosalina sp. J07AB43]